ncbi:MAG: glycerol-3-phosphate acyltransferase [Dehalococcoidia bacterium]
MELAGLYIFAYLIGSVPTAYLIGRLVKGIDIRQYGSGNVGGTNVAQHVGKLWFVFLTLFEVLGKGAAPVWVGVYGLGLDPASWPLLTAPLLAVAGHNWSVFLKFQGGRGVAVAGGTVLALSLPVWAIACLVALVGWALTRSSGVWVLVSLASLPVWTLLFGEASNLIWYSVVLLGVVVLKRLLSNWTPFPRELPRRQVLFNRLFRDRDVKGRGQWVGRMPGGTE